MLRIAEHFHASDLGRQRQGNEDNYFVRAPLFVVADGMGGAQAGEVASEMAVESFDGGLPDGAPAEGLVERHRGGQPRASTTARAPTSSARAWAPRSPRRTSARHDVTVAHVGDSRAYLLRGGDLDPAHARPLAGRRARRARQAHRGAGRGAPAALGDHPRARARSPTCRSTSRRSARAAATSSCSARTA